MADEAATLVINQSGSVTQYLAMLLKPSVLQVAKALCFVLSKPVHSYQCSLFQGFDFANSKLLGVKYWSIKRYGFFPIHSE